MMSLSRIQAFLILAALWAAIYLPGLGSTELKGEEGRRVLPAVAMLEDGNWLVPHLGGKPYLRKPPLMNWVIAASFSATGRRDEWAARLPSALMVLGLGGTVVALSSGGGWMQPGTGLLAALMAITPLGLLAKARFAGAEIEGVYVPLSGMAIAIWMAWHAQRRSAWLLWTVPGIFLGLAALAKGPSFHLLAYYSVVLATLGATRNLRRLLHPAHFLGIAVAAGIFCAWAVPFSKNPEALSAGRVWKKQGLDRFRDGEFAAGEYLMNLPRALSDQLPWLLLAPAFAGGFIWRRRQAVPVEAQAGSGVQDEPGAEGVVAAVLSVLWGGLLLVPGMLPRYVLPFGTIFALLLARRISEGSMSSGLLRIWHRTNKGLAGLVLALLLLGPLAAGWPSGQGGLPAEVSSLHRFRFELGFPAALACLIPLGVVIAVLVRRGVGLEPVGLGIRTGALLGAASVWYSIAVVPWMVGGERSRPLAREIDGIVPAGETLVVCDPDYLPALFYLRTPYVCRRSWRESVVGGGWVLVRESEWGKRVGRGEVAGWEKVWVRGNVQGGGLCLIRRTALGGAGL
jgi:4-amino-4-deoxy-L-arabinose transferase-like glycosyltransferase